MTTAEIENTMLDLRRMETTIREVFFKMQEVCYDFPIKDNKEALKDLSLALKKAESESKRFFEKEWEEVRE